MAFDLSKFFQEWPHGDGPTARKIVGDDGREKVQIRVCIDSFHGILQFECDGRPDGKRPYGREFFFDHLEDKQRKHLESGGDPAGFRLTRAQCRKVFDESAQVYHRYVVMLQMGDYARVIRDTARNMRVFRFVNAHAAHAGDRTRNECWWPYILRIHHTAAVMRHLENGKLDEALESIAACVRRIQELPDQESEVFQLERKRSIEALDQMEKEIRDRKPLSELERLEKEKAEAIEQQRYEEAARLRDRINNIRNRNA